MQEFLQRVLPDIRPAAARGKRLFKFAEQNDDFVALYRYNNHGDRRNRDRKYSAGYALTLIRHDHISDIADDDQHRGHKHSLS